MSGIGVQEALQGRDAEVELGVVGRVRNAEGARDLKECPGDEIGLVLGFRVANQLVPGEPRGQGLSGRELGLSQTEAGGVKIGGIEIRLGVFGQI